MRIAFIGAGNMAGAIIRGMRRASFAGTDIVAYDIDSGKTAALARECGIAAADNNCRFALIKSAVTNCTVRDSFSCVICFFRQT